LLASAPRLGRRDIALITIAGIAPDIDGLGIVPELLTRSSAHPLDWFSGYHHVLAHNLLFAVLTAAVVFFFARRRWLTALLALMAVHLHLLMDILGSRGPDGYSWPIPYLEPFSSTIQLTWSGQWALNSWPNIAITCALLAVTLVRALQINRSPVEIFSPAADHRVVSALRARFASNQTKAVGSGR
jgi:hypothetical protein